LAIYAIIKALFWSGKKDHGRYEERKMTRLLWVILTVILGIAGVVFFCLTENIRLPMRFFDIWTVVNAVIFIAGILCVLLSFKTEKDEYRR